MQETFGKVLAEALACGTHVIVNNATANPEIAGDDCRMCFENNNVNQIVNAVNKMKKIGKSSYTERCVNRATNEFNLESQMKKYLQLFSDMILWKEKSSNI